jgi:hypothetical protein
MGLNGFIFKKIYIDMKDRKRFWGPFRIYLLNIPANSAQSTDLGVKMAMYMRAGMPIPLNFFMLILMI